MGMKIKKGDRVIVVTGKDKGVTGKVIEAYPETERVLVEGVNRIKKHTKVGQSTRGAKTGGIVTQEAPVHVSNVMLVVEVDGKKVGSRVGYRVEKVDRDGREKTVGSASPSGPVRTSDEPPRPPRRPPHGSTGCRRGSRRATARRSWPQLREEFGYANVMQVPGLAKIVVNMGVGDAAKDSKLIDGAIRDLATITGQKPQVTKARKSIAQFKLREGMPIGCHVTLRGDRMWEFLDRLLSLALPRIRDFRGLSPKQFDGNGNYTFGLNEQSMFHEIDQDRIDRVRGMDITVVTTATTDDEGRALLRHLGFPFKEA